MSIYINLYQKYCTKFWRFEILQYLCRIISKLQVEKNDPILVHSLDWSPFEYGFTVDKRYHKGIFNALGKEIPVGSSIPVVIEYDGEKYNAVFDRPDVKGRSGDVVRLLYRGKRTLGDKLKEHYPRVYKYIKDLKEIHGGRHQVTLPENLRVNLCIFQKDTPSEYYLSCMNE